MSVEAILKPSFLFSSSYMIIIFFLTFLFAGPCPGAVLSLTWDEVMEGKSIMKMGKTEQILELLVIQIANYIALLHYIACLSKCQIVEAHY